MYVPYAVSLDRETVKSTEPMEAKLSVAFYDAQGYKDDLFF